MSTTISGTGVATGIASVISIIGAVYGFLNHKRIRARCCGRELSASIDIDDKATPKVVEVASKTIEINEPVVLRYSKPSHKREGPRRASTG